MIPSFDPLFKVAAAILLLATWKVADLIMFVCAHVTIH